MDTKTMLQSCISHCQNVKTDITNIGQSATNARAKDELNKAIQSIDACISQCKTAVTNL